MRRLFWLLLLLLNVTALCGKGYHYSYTNNCKEAYRQYICLNSTAGDATIKRELLSDPYNLMATYIADYHDCFTLLFNGNKLDYQQLKHHQEQRLALLEKGDTKSPWHRLCRAGIYMHWAFVHLRFEENLKAATNFRRSYLLLKENRRLFPDFEYNNIFLGMEEATVGAIPDNYKWVASIFGMRGNINSGIARVKKFIATHKPGDPLYDEAMIYYSYLCYYVGSDKEEAWKTLSSPNFDTKGKLVFSFVKTNIAINYRKAEAAISILQEASLSEDYVRYPIFQYEYGYALMHRLDKEATEKFTAFLKNYNGRIFIKDALQKMAYMYYLDGNKTAAANCKSRIVNEGTATTDSDKQALRFAQQANWPNETLLKAQLLTDGGYYREAYKILSKVIPSQNNSIAFQLEYYFRYARVSDELGNTDDALKYYNMAIKAGTGRKEQFAARAALQLGFLYEKMKQYPKAISMYQLALSMPDHDFKNSIDQQAKAGIKRLSENN